VPGKRAGARPRAQMMLSQRSRRALEAAGAEPACCSEGSPTVQGIVSLASGKTFVRPRSSYLVRARARCRRRRAGGCAALWRSLARRRRGPAARAGADAPRRRPGAPRGARGGPGGRRVRGARHQLPLRPQPAGDRRGEQHRRAGRPRRARRGAVRPAGRRRRRQQHRPRPAAGALPRRRCCGGRRVRRRRPGPGLSARGAAQAADPELRVAVRFRPEKSGYLTFHGVDAPPQIPAEHAPRQWLYMISDATKAGRASSTMWRDEQGRVSGARAPRALSEGAVHACRASRRRRPHRSSSRLRPGRPRAPGMLVQPSNLEQAQQEALLASAFPQLPGAFRHEVAAQTCSGSQAVSAFGHICQARGRAWRLVCMRTRTSRPACARMPPCACAPSLPRSLPPGRRRRARAVLQIPQRARDPAGRQRARRHVHARPGASQRLLPRPSGHGPCRAAAPLRCPKYIDWIS